MSAVRILLSEIIIFATGLLSSVGGFGGSAVRFPFMVAVLGILEAKTVMNMISLISGGFVSIDGKRDINVKESVKIISLVGVGELIGLWICSIIPANAAFLKGFGVLITLVGIYRLIVKTEPKLPESVLIAILLFSGVIQAMYLSGGVLTSLYAVQKLKKKEEFRATMNLVWFVAALIQIPTYIKAGSYTKEACTIIILAIIPLFVTAKLGRIILTRINQENFVKFVYILLIVLGILTIFK